MADICALGSEQIKRSGVKLTRSNALREAWRIPGFAEVSSIRFERRPVGTASGWKSITLSRFQLLPGSVSGFGCHPNQGDAQTGVCMFEQEVFSKRHPLFPCPIRLDPGGLGSVGVTRRPEGVLAPDAACRETISCVAFFCEAHNCSNKWVGCLE